jgi:phosphatidylglycerophosphate synthase
MSERRPAAKRLLTAITIGRIALIPVIALSFTSSPAVTSVSLLAFMFADLFDGVLARAVGDDGPARRALDSAVDRIAIDACLVAAAAVGAMPLLFVCAFLIRDLYCAVICALMMGERRVAIKADLLYRGLNCGLAGWALAAPFVSAGGRLAGAAVLFAASLVVAGDLTRSIRFVRRAPATVRSCVIAAADLRHGRVDWQACDRRHDATESWGISDKREVAVARLPALQVTAPRI